MKLVRYADDFVVLIHGQRADAEALWDEVAAVLAPMGLRLSVEKTRVCHIDEGFDFLGWRIQRRTRVCMFSPRCRLRSQPTIRQKAK